MNKKDKWVREVAKEYGIADERIGFDSDSGYVTLDGEKLAKPDYIENGKSYFADTSGIEDAFSKDSVAISDYAASKAIPVSVGYDGDVWVNGQLIKNATVKDGKAYAKASLVDAAISGKTQDDIVKEAEEKFGAKREAALKKAEENKFSYNPEKDESYIAAKNSYEESAKRAAEDAAAEYAALTGGMGNSMAVTAAAKAAGGNAEKLAAKIPELYELAYQKYKSEQEGYLDLAEAYDQAIKQYFDINSSALKQDNAQIADNNKYIYNRAEDAKDRAEDEAKAIEEKKPELSESDAKDFIKRAFVSDTGVNLTGIKLYLDSLSDFFPEETRNKLLQMYQG